MILKSVHLATEYLPLRLDHCFKPAHQELVKGPPVAFVWFVCLSEILSHMKKQR